MPIFIPTPKMKKLSDTWKQRKPVFGAARSRDLGVGESVASRITNTKRLGRVAIQTVSSKNKSVSTCGSTDHSSDNAETKAQAAGNLENPGCSFSSSFAVDFDTDVIKAVDSLEAAACKAFSNTDKHASHNSVAARTPINRHKQALGQHSNNPGKRKNARRSSVRKQSLFGDDSGGCLAAEAFTPTHSPRNKKRKEADQTLLSTTFKNRQLLCPASPSPELPSNQHHRDEEVCPVPLLMPRERVLHKVTKKDVSNENGTMKEDDKVEIETDVSPVLDLSEQNLKTVKSKNNPKHGAHIASSSTKVSVEGSGMIHVKNKINTGRSENAKPKSGARSSASSNQFDLDSDKKLSSETHSKGDPSPLLTSAEVPSTQPPVCMKVNDHLAHDGCKGKTSQNHKFTGLKYYGNKSLIQKNHTTNGASVLKPSETNSKAVSGSVSMSKSLTSSKIVPAAHRSFNHEMEQDHKGSGNISLKCNNVVEHTTNSEKCTEMHRSSTCKSRRACSPASAAAASDTDCSDTRLQQAAKSEDQLAAGTGSRTAESLLLSSWGLPSPVLEAYQGQGINAMFPWQAECLSTGNVLNGGNLVYSAPTSAGKTMVAELLILKRVLETRRKALFILPFVSVTREKMISLQRLYQDAGVRVGGFMGSHSPVGGLQSLDVAVCTIEKGNGLVNRLMEDNRMDELGVLVIDELHMVGDPNRGYLLELLLTKICYMARKSRQNTEHGIQVIGMSATLPNLDLLASWLDADLYHTDFRPVPLTQNIKVGTVIYNEAMTKVRELEVKSTFQGDEDHIIPLCLETIMGGHSVLIFCPTKAWCEKMAEKIAREFYSLMKNPAALAAYTGETGFVKASEMARLPIDQASLRNVLEQLGRSPVGVDPMLGKVLNYAVAYHHAGLTFDERDIVEGAFRQGLVKVLVATSTLSSGVNLPARRVIVRSPLFGGRVIDALAYKQMAGRAGRKGVDTEGECVLVCKEGERKMAQGLLSSDLPPVTSCLQGAGDGCQLSRSLKRAVLEVVVSGVASTPEDVAHYVECTLLSASLPSDDNGTAELVAACLSFLEDNEFVTLHTVRDSEDKEVQEYQPTQLGSAVLASSMSPDEGLAVFKELQKARQCFVLANELHIIYLVTPIYSQEISGHLEWYHFYCLWDKLSPDMTLVAKTVGVEEAFLAKAITGRVPTKTMAQARVVAIHRRFYLALALHDLVQEMPLMEVAAKYNCNKGQLQSLMQSAATFAGMVTVFCARLGWSNMELLFTQFQQRLTLGVTRELCDLVRIPLLTATMARVLFNAGYQTVAGVAHAAPEEVETIFRKASPFQSTKKQDGESDWELEQRRKARCMWLAGRRGVTELEAATAIITEAKTIIQQELGVQIQWGQTGGADTSDSRHIDVEMSASRTVLERSPNSSVLSKESPLLSSRNSSVSSKVSPVVEGGHTSVTSAESMPSGSKRKSPGSEAFHTPVASCQSRRSLSCRSMLKRNSYGKNVSNRKSPSANSGVSAEAKTGLQKTRSPSSASFFGQVVVSPPPSMKPQRKVTCSIQMEGNTPHSKLVRDHNKKSPILSAAFDAKQASKIIDHSKHLSGNIHSTSQLEGILQMSHDCGVLKRSARNSLPKSDSAGNTCAHTHQSSHSSQEPNADDHHRKLSRQQQISSLGAAFKTNTHSGSEIEQVRDVDIPQPSHDKGTSTLSVKAAVQPLENPTGLSHVQNHSDDCFDESLILNTQTDNLLSGCLNEFHSVCDKSVENVAASTPLASTQSVSKDKNSDHSSAQSGPRDYVVRDELSETDVDRKQVYKKLHRTPESNTPGARSSLTTLDPPNLPQDHSPSSLCEEEESFPDDMFTSPFTSSTHCGGQQQQSSTKKTLTAVTAWKEKGHRTWQEQPQNRDDVRDTACGSEAEDSVELIAASNYDRVAYVEEGLMEDSADGSYQDLASAAKSGISGRLLYADRDPEERTEQEELPKLEDPYCCGDYDIQKDLAIEAHLNDSFSLPVNNSVVNKTPPQSSPNRAPESCPLDCSTGDGLSTSFTMSMMEKAFADEFFSNSANEIHPLKEAALQKSVSWQDQKTGGAESDPGTELDTKRSLSISEKESLAPKETVTDTGRQFSKENKTHHRGKYLSGPAKSSTPRSSEEFIPPTPPEENSLAVSSPRVSVRCTPFRACKSKPDSQQQTGQIPSIVHHETKRRKAKDKENAPAKHKSQKKQAVRSLQTALDNPKAVHHIQTTKENSQAAHKISPQKCSAVEVSPPRLELDTREKENEVISSPRDQPLPEHGAGKELAIDLDSPPPTQDSLCIIDVCSSAQLFATFAAEWRSKQQYAISLACEKKVSSVQIRPAIGSHFMQGKPASREVDSGRQQGMEVPGDEDRVIVGLAVSWADHDAYYISLLPHSTVSPESDELDDTLAAPPCTQSVSQEHKIQLVKEVLQQTRDKCSMHTMVVFDSKSTYTLLARGLGVVFGRCRDPQIACWLLDPGAREKTLHSMVTNYLPTDLSLLEGIGGSMGYGSLGLMTQCMGTGRMRAVVESIVARHLMDHFWKCLTDVGLAAAFRDTEMPSVLTLARMELNGFGFSEEECESQKNVMMSKLSALEQEAYTLAGHPFSLTSTDDIAQVLYLELHLPVNGDPSATKPVRTLGPSRRAPRGRHKSSFSTSKDILEKLKAYHPLPALILEWRRISSALTKHVYPLQKEKVYCKRLYMHRIFSVSQMHTATGRVSMMEPNLQNIPKDFDIALPDVIGESPPAMPSTSHHARGKAGNSRLQAMRGATPQKTRLSDPTKAMYTAVSMRHAFAPFPGGVILAADYSQLELRVIAHLSSDAKLISILNNDGDVFKLIAAQWKNTMPELVTSEERQHAKQICYGMLYGIGPKALGEQIGVDENDATVFMESFKAKYTGMRSYLRKTVEQCRDSGYVTTVTGRRRYLPAIKDTNPHARAQAERQAVNSTVQGSAADIVKTAMNAIDRELVQVFPDTQFPHRHCHAEAERPRGAFLTLQLHDELIYEVSRGDLQQVACIIKHCMETTTPLSVQLPVKVKVGPSWGRLQDMDL